MQKWSVDEGHEGGFVPKNRKVLHESFVEGKMGRSNSQVEFMSFVGGMRW
jgi:hypothetical protein